MLQRPDRFRKGAVRWRQPMWLPRTPSTGRRWWMHGKCWVRPTPRSAQRPAWFQRGDCRQGEPTRATFDNLPSSEALFNRETCRRWRKRSSSPCLPRAKKRWQPEDVYPPSRQWPPWAGSPLLQWDRLWRLSKAAADSPGQRQFGGLDLLQLMAESCSRGGGGKYTQQRSCPSPCCARWGKSRTPPPDYATLGTVRADMGFMAPQDRPW